MEWSPSRYFFKAGVYYILALITPIWLLQQEPILSIIQTVALTIGSACQLATGLRKYHA